MGAIERAHDDNPENAARDDSPRYVLITECLQNDFVLNGQCRLALPESIARLVLLGRETPGLKATRVKASRRKEVDGVRPLPPEAIAGGPLALFLDDTIGSRMRGEKSRGVLHVINIRDWHVPDQNYDFERRSYGTHCEASTWADLERGREGVPQGQVGARRSARSASGERRRSCASARS